MNLQPTESPVNRPEVNLAPGNRVTCFAVNNGVGVRILLVTAQDKRGDERFCLNCPANQPCQNLHKEMKGS
ncbi:MAG: hypothetical protein KBD27_01940 [Candidatus Moranbacteria bacterium]|nr:hypothetical protein [Candidatus Moranbacteria bacterium]